MAVPLHVVHVNFAKGFRGGERQTLNLIEGLSSHMLTQTLVCRTGSSLAHRAKIAGITLREVSHPLRGHLSALHASVVHVHEARGAYWAALEATFRSTPYLITRRIPNAISSSVVTSAVYRHAAEVVAVSADIAVRLGAQIRRTPKVILDCCTDLPVDVDKVTSIRLQLADHGDVGPVIGHVGAMVDHHKGQSVLIRAFQQLCAQIPTARLLLVGDGPDRARFEQLANGDPRIVFAGFQDDVGNWLAAMDVMAFPSREEGLGSSVLDAMRLKVPVIAAAVGGLPELIGTQQRGLLLHNHEPQAWATAMIDVLSDASLRQQRVEAAFRFAEANDAAAMANAYLALYRSMVGG